MTRDPDLYFVPAADGRHQLTERGSKFIGAARHVHTPHEAEALVDAARRQYPDASHHCYAWRLGSEHRIHDAGEPAGTAGQPILAAIDAAGITETAVVVTRYFGGTKLGSGGLRRAYGETARGALSAAGRTARYHTGVVTVSFEFSDTSPVHHVAGRFGARQVGAAYGDRVALQFELRASRVADFGQALIEATGGRAEVCEPAL